MVDPGGQGSAGDLNNLAFLLLQEVQAARAPRSRLAEARNYAERALAIKEKVDASVGEIWNTLGHLVSIAELEGRTEEARNYQRRERETFAAFEGNRSRIDHRFGSFIADVVAAAKGNAWARVKVEAVLPQAKEHGWHIGGAIQRIWAGEREWHALVEDLNAQEALLVLRVLETIAQPTTQ